MRVLTEIWRYPLKSAQGESLSRVDIGANGPLGDRAWACVTAEGRIVSAKNPRRFGRLLDVVAVTDEGTDEGDGDVVSLHVPDAKAPVLAGSPDADDAVSRLLGAPVTLTRVVPGDASLERYWPSEAGMVPDWVAAAPGDVVVGETQGPGLRGRFVDFAALHLVTVQELTSLAERGVDADVRRFRPNLVVDLEPAPRPGDVLRIGDALTLEVVMPTPRCAIPGAAQPGLPPAPGLLRELGNNRAEVAGRGRAAVFGVYADVVRPGTVTVGDPVRAPR